MPRERGSQQKTKAKVLKPPQGSGLNPSFESATDQLCIPTEQPQMSSFSFDVHAASGGWQGDTDSAFPTQMSSGNSCKFIALLFADALTILQHCTAGTGRAPTSMAASLTATPMVLHLWSRTCRAPTSVAASLTATPTVLHLWSRTCRVPTSMATSLTATPMVHHLWSIALALMITVMLTLTVPTITL
jgi:hypothetical protein